MTRSDQDNHSAITGSAELWVWRPAGQDASASGWHFLTIAPPDNRAASDALHAQRIEMRMLGAGRGFGSVKVMVRIGGSRFATSVFPHRESGGWLLPIKAQVRRAERIGAGDRVEFSLTV